MLKSLSPLRLPVSPQRRIRFFVSVAALTGGAEILQIKQNPLRA